MVYAVDISDEKNHGIYKITNLISGKVYIGQTRASFRKRYLKHVSEFKSGKGHNKEFANDYIKYGEQNFLYEIVQVENDDSKLDGLEKKYIEEYDAINSGYNKSKGGNPFYKDKPVSEVFKSDRVYDEVFREGRRRYMSGRVVKQETKDRLRYANLGSRSPVAVLDEGVVKKMKEDMVAGVTLKDISEKYHIKYSTVSSVSSGRSWSHVVVDGFDDYVNAKKKRVYFSDDEVREIRKLLSLGYSESAIARKYKCCSSKVNSIHRGLTYSDVV